MHIRTLFLTLCLALASLTALAQTSETRTHVVQRGETLELIASRYGVSESALLEANPMAKEMFFIGMKLTIPPSSAASAASDDAQNEAKAEGPSQKKDDGKGSAASDGYTTGLSLSDNRASFYFPVKKEPSTVGHYHSNYEISYEVNGIYRFPHRVFTKFGLGVNAQGSETSDKVKDQVRPVQYSTSYVHLYVPIRVGYQLPLWKHAHLDLYTGARLFCLVGGYEKHRGIEGEKEWVKTKVKDMKNPKRFHAAWTVGADLNFGGFGIGCEYLHTLEHHPLKSLDKGAIAATLFFSFD